MCDWQAGCRSQIPLHDLHVAALDGLDPTQRTAVICQSSARSGIGASILAWLFAGHYTQRVHVTGLLVPRAGLGPEVTPPAAPPAP